MREKVLKFIRERALLRAGDRVAAAVSGGADSVALLRVLVDLRADIGIVLSVAHFNHGLRGDESLADEAFVADLAKQHGLDFFAGHGDVRDHAFTTQLSLEAAGRELRYRWLSQLAREHRLNAIATAHTRDDQAETVLLKLLRGAGTRGLAGIFPVVGFGTAGAKAPDPEKACNGVPEGAPLPHGDLSQRASTQPQSAELRVVRPLLCVARQDVEGYLSSLGQPWREDESNLDRRFLRNRVRHVLLPLLEREFNPNVRQVLSDLAELARSEEDYWNQHVGPKLVARINGHRLELNGFSALDVALQRRMLKAFAERQHLTLDFGQVESLRRCALGEQRKAELPGGWVAAKRGRSLEVSSAKERPETSYCYRLPIPGEVEIPELAFTLRAWLVPAEFAAEAPPGELLSLELVGAELTVRNWRPGDRFQPAHSASEEKLKRLFLEKRVPAEERPCWPVALCHHKVVWVRGFLVARSHCWQGTGDAVRLEIVPK